MNQFWRIAPHTQPLDVEERASLLLDALSAAAIAKASQKAAKSPELDRTSVEQWNDLDGSLESVLAESEFRKAAKTATEEGYFFPSGPSYTVEELDEELNR
ncbi:hypothetical protein M3672_14980 [Microbacterium enclense]|uniref:hypothetical protein n=1 Tax=Microbacterium enclense TaxID=993073 RepID=UPI00203B3860|nr:hypothetical protein [Microbacterium enclense]MCM3615734.1 hypothetical protein [Microbacterium enclense]